MGWAGRTLLYFTAGGLVGFLVLGEFALASSIPVLGGLLILALAALGGAVRHRPSLSVWSVFLLAAIVVPLMISARVVGLPRYAEVSPGVACLASERDYQSPFWIELGIFGLAVVGSALHLGTATGSRPTPRP